MNWLQRRYTAFIEVRNWFYIKRVIKRNLSTDMWSKFDLHKGYVGQIYTVISLRKEDMGENETIQRMKIIERIEPLNKYLESLNLSEIIYPEIVKLPESRSWLIVYWPSWYYFSIWRLIFQIIGISIFYFIGRSFGLWDWLMSLITNI